MYRCDIVVILVPRGHKAAKASKAASSLTHSHTETPRLFSQGHFMVLLLPIYGNQSRKQMLQTTFQKHPEKCKQRLVSACSGGKVCAGRQPADSPFYAHDLSFLRNKKTHSRTEIEICSVFLFK